MMLRAKGETGGSLESSITGDTCEISEAVERTGINIQ